MSIADFFFGRKQNSSNKRSIASRTRNLRMEALEERALLSVTPLSPDEYSALSAQYAQFHLPEDMSDLNVITLDLAEGDGLAELKSAIETAGSTDESDLIVVRTSDDANTITFTSNSDELLININASSKGAITIVGLGTKPLTLDAAQQCRVITVSGTNDDAYTVANLGGLTITNGISANSVEKADFGGGIYCQYGTLMAANCAFSENTAASGGGIYNYAGALTVANCAFSGNSASSGGGIYNDYCGSLTITDSTFSENTADSGGGIYCNNSNSGTFTISNCLFSNNTASIRGGVIFNETGTLTLIESTFSENTASEYGGGIYNSAALTASSSIFSKNTASTYSGGGIFSDNGGTLTITDCTFSENTAASSGGGIYFFSGTSSVTDSTFSKNEASSFGGGIYGFNTDLNLTVVNCILSRNTAYSGGAIFNDRGTLTVTNSTISGNTATQSADSGDGIYNDEDAQSATVNNSIVIDGIKNQATISGSNNLSVFSDWTSGSDNVDYDSTKPLFVDAANDDYRLIKDSQAIDKGNNALAVDANGQPLVYDLDDCSRIINNTVDFGAYEYNAQLNAPTLSASTAGSDSITVTVGEVEHATGYTVEYSTSSDFADSTIQNVSAGNTTITGLNVNTKYYFRAMALGGGVYTDSDYSQTASATTDRIKLTAPTLSVSTAGSYSVKVTVGEVAHATGYTIEYSTSPDFSNPTIHNVSAGDMTIAGLNANTTYYFRAMALGEGDYANSDYSQTVSATTDRIKLTPPTLSASAAGSDSIAITVGEVEHATGYTVEYATSSDFTNPTIQNVPAGDTIIVGLNANTKYYFRVMAHGGGDYTDSDYCQTVSATTNRVQLTAPTLSASMVNSNSIKFTVGEVEHATEYTVEYATSSDFANPTSQNVPAGDTTVVGLNANTMYYFRAMALSEGDYANSDYSQTASATTDRMALTTPTLSSSVTNTTAAFTWDEVPNAIGYQFEYKVTDAAEWNIETVEGTSFSFEGDRDTTYIGRVKALGENFYKDSDFSDEQRAYINGISVTIENNKVTVNWFDESRAGDSIRYRVEGTTRWTTSKLKEGVTTFSFNGTIGKDYEIEVLLDQQEAKVYKATAVILDQPKLKADKAFIKDDSFQVNVTNYTAKNLSANAKHAILTVNGAQTTLDIVNQEGSADLAGGGKVAFNNGLFTFTEMTSNTQYKIQVSFSDDISVSKASSVLTVKTLKAPYLAPNITSVAAVSDTSITVTWESSMGKDSDVEAQKYTVQYSTDGNRWTNAATGATGNSYTIQRLKGGVEYQVRVLATKDKAFEASDPSEVLRAETLALPKIALERNSVKDDSFQVNVTNYQTTNIPKATILNVKSDKFGEAAIEVNGGKGTATLNDGVTVSFDNGALTFTNVPSATQQKIQVNFNAGTCTTAWSSALSVKTAKAAYNKPVLTNAVADSSTSIVVEWAPVTGKNSDTAAQKYTVQYTLDGNRWTNAATSVTGTNFTITRLKAGTTYRVAVIANKDSYFNASEPSESLEVRTL